jgi:hypothetical protein
MRRGNQLNPAALFLIRERDFPEARPYRTKDASAIVRQGVL